MGKIDNGGQAFPTARVTINGETATDGVETYGPGLTKREYFAGQILAGICAAGQPYGSPASRRTDGMLANDAVKLADALIAALEGGA